jgi:hypothetical protein
MFASDTASEMAFIRLKSLKRLDTYLGTYAIQGYIGLVVIFLVVYVVIRLRHRYLMPVYYLILGIYYDIMINGAQAGHIHALFDEAVRPSMPLLTQMPFYLVLPFLVMLGLPLLVAYIAAKAVRTSREPGQ